MSAEQILEEIRRKPEAERRELFERIFDEFADFDDELTPEQIAEFERRGAELRQHPERGIPWEKVRAELSPGKTDLIDRRLQDHLDNPGDVISKEELKAKLDAKYGK